MKVFCLIGSHSNSGKTTTACEIIRNLKKRNYSVSALKDIHIEGFSIDSEGKDTWLMSEAGANPVISFSEKETGIIYRKRLPIDSIKQHLSSDYLVIEGGKSFYYPAIAVSDGVDDLEKIVDERVFAISGPVSRDVSTFKNIPVFDIYKSIDEFVDYIMDIVPPALPFFDDDCCRFCGMTCSEMLVKLLRKEKNINECIAYANNKIKLKIGEKTIDMVPFVQDTLVDVIKGFLRNLKGYDSQASIEIIIK
ncbi:MAG: molybdopterin-guanine dinucleotide biosynthesis protein MobB [Candidatus Coatesbacteria bacterium]|nr:molybdopterin-guanine dinucleotide biosynthesis protein MobB [Candidatus Coatesbacteria bacterium]